MTRPRSYAGLPASCRAIRTLTLWTNIIRRGKRRPSQNFPTLTAESATRSLSGRWLTHERLACGDWTGVGAACGPGSSSSRFPRRFETGPVGFDFLWFVAVRNDLWASLATPPVNGANVVLCGRHKRLPCGGDTRAWCLDIFAAEPMLSQRLRRGSPRSG